MAHEVWNEHRFRQQVAKALGTIKTVLENTRSPTYAADEDHSYDDKYALSEFLANSALASQVNALERMGVDADKLARLKEMSASRSVTLRFAAKETCTFVKEVEVDQESAHKYVVEKEHRGSKETTTHKVVTTITEYHWVFGLDYELYAFCGNTPDDRVELQSRSCKHDIVRTGDKSPPAPDTTVPTPIDVALTWLLQNLSAESVCSFAIDRAAKSCRTPRRNDEVQAGLEFFSAFRNWANNIPAYLRHVAGRHGARSGAPGVTSLNVDASDLFVPVLPLFEDPAKSGRAAAGAIAGAAAAAAAEPTAAAGSMVAMAGLPTGAIASPLLSVGDINRFLTEQCNSLARKREALTQTYPAKEGDKLISVAEAWLSVLALHTAQIADHYVDGVGYIEDMLSSQLVAAIGKELQPKDFAEFVRFHERKLFLPEYAPQPFCYAIRRPDHYPDGTLSIESRAGSQEPILTITRKLPPGPDGVAPAMHFPINAATTVEFKGDRFLHAWVAHEFGAGNTTRHSAPAAAQVDLVARARQFSSFLLLVGKISGPDSFAPEHAIILQNKDELMLPLLLEQLPTPQEFKDAIESLSPEQKRFATAIRAMQLESSVFGVCVVQLKPQLEALLGLDDDALTKEIKLTQDLLSLFIEYQIPSDLLSFDGNHDAEGSEKLTAVKGHVAAVQDMLKAAREEEIAEQEEKARLEKERMEAAKAEAKRLEAEANSMRMQSMAMDSMEMEMASMAAPSMMAAPMMARGGHPERMMMKSRAMAGAAPGAGAPPGPPDRQKKAMRSRARGSGGAPPPPAIAMAAPAPAPAPAPAQPASTPSTSQPEGGGSGPTGEGGPGALDLTQIPQQLDAQFEALDEDSSLRPTIIKTGDHWTKRSQKSLLGKLVQTNLDSSAQKTEKDKAFDLLDALSRSGALPIACAELHVMVAATHCFDKSLIGTVIQDNVNPIEKLERSTLIVASTIHGVPAAELLKDDQQARVLEYSPGLFPDDAEALLEPEPEPDTARP